jgi:hypothetical protein
LGLNRCPGALTCQGSALVEQHVPQSASSTRF